MSDSENNTTPEVAPKVAKTSKPKKPSKPKSLAKGKAAKGELPNPVWFKPVMFGFMLLGLAWIVTYYISGSQLPLGKMFPEVDIDAWNIVVGFGLLMVGFGMSTRWK
jgi:hypothetical protein